MPVIKNLCMYCVLFTSPLLNAAERIVIATEVLEPVYVNQSGNGLYQQLMAKIFSDYDIVYEYASYERAKNRVLGHQAHLWLGAYLNEESNALYAQIPFDADNLVAIYLRQQYAADISMAQLRQATAVWLKGYDLHLYYAQFRERFVEADDFDVGIRLVTGRRVDVFINDASDTENAMAQRGGDYTQLRVTPIGRLPLYAAFAGQPSAHTLIAIWDKRMMELYQSGELQALFASFGEQYPFTLPMRKGQ